MRRLNVKLTLWLVGITLFSVVSVHFLHGFQIDRNAEFLRKQAETAQKDGNSKEAIKQYNQYLKYRDDPDGYSALASLVLDVANEDDASRQDKFKAYSTLQVAIRRHPDLKEVRRRLIDYTMDPRIGRFAEALEHIEYLVPEPKEAKDITDSGLEYKRAVCKLRTGEEAQAIAELYMLLGYDEKAEQFQAEAPPSAKEVDAYVLLSQILLRKVDGPKRADEVMAQLVKLNPESAKAHLSYSNYLVGTNRLEEAKPELERALELAPDDADTLLAAAAFALMEKDFAKCQGILDRALKLFPTRPEVYVALAQLAIFQSDTPLAAERLEQGLTAVTAHETSAILKMLVEIQFMLGRSDAVRVTCGKMPGANLPPEYIHYQEARLLLAERDFAGAAREFEAVRQPLSRSPMYASLVAQLDVLLARCYEFLGQPDRQLEACRRILQTQPDQFDARLGEASALQALGRYDQAETDLKILTINADRFPALMQTLALLTTDRLQRPEAARNWDDVDKVADLLFQAKDRTALDNDLVRIDLLLMKNDVPGAREIASRLRKEYPKDPRVWVSIAKVLLRDDKADRIPQLLNLAEKESGESTQLLMERVRLVLREGGENASRELAKLEASTEKLSDAERASLMYGFGNAYLQARDPENTKRCWRSYAEKQPTNGSIRQTLFELAIDTNDEAGMDATLKEIEASPHFGPESTLYKYCAAAKLVAPITFRLRSKGGQLTEADRVAIAEARSLVEGALLTRSEWSVLFRLRAELNQLEGNVAGAIADYQHSLECSRIGQTATARRLVQLLYMNRRFDEARDAIKYVGPTGPSEFITKVIEDLQIRTGKAEEIESALARASKTVEAEPTKAANYAWYGNLLNRAGRTGEAETIFRKGIEVDPNHAEIWDSLVQHLIAAKKKAEATEAVREASKSLADQPLALGLLYERVGDLAQAENYYQTALEKKPDDLPAMRNIAEFFLRNSKRDEAKPYLEKIIEKTSQSKDKTNLALLFWARRYRAQSIATPRTAQEPPDYEQVVEAVKLIEQNTDNGQLSAEDSRVMFILLANRPEPESRAKATKVLEDLKRRNLLTPREQLALGQLYDRAGDWPQARDTILGAVSRSSEDLEILITFAQLLLKHDEYDDATRWVDRLDDLISKTPVANADVLKASSRELRARLLAKKGQSEQAVQVLEGLVPNPLPQNQLVLLEKVARLLEEMEQYPAAEKLLNEYVSQEDRGTIALAAFLGRRGDLDKSFELLEKARKNQPAIEILPVAIEGLRWNPDKASKERFAQVEEWIKSALESEANPRRIQLLAAELYDLQGRYPETIKIYRALLADKDINTTEKATVKNNLGFVLAITKDSPESGKEALKLTQEAIRVLGPASDLLDTRALAYLAVGDTKNALADLQAATADAPSPSKYFHLAQAEKQANNIEAARAAMASAEKATQDSPQGSRVSQFTPLEKQNYARLADELK